MLSALLWLDPIDVDLEHRKRAIPSATIKFIEASAQFVVLYVTIE